MNSKTIQRLGVVLVTVVGLAMLATPADAGFRGHNASKGSLRTAPLPRPSGWIHIYAENTREEVRVNIYNPDGSYNQESLAALDKVWRDQRRKEERAVDPRLYEMVSIVFDHFEGRRLLLGSGFRVERQTSRHYHASAVDFRVEGVSYTKLYEYVQTLDMGGMGMGKYPTSQFVHMDYRAPGEPSFRWTDTSGSSKKARGKSKGKSKKSSGPKVLRSKKPNT